MEKRIVKPQTLTPVDGLSMESCVGSAARERSAAAVVLYAAARSSTEICGAVDGL
jgi:hypothetical protein